MRRLRRIAPLQHILHNHGNIKEADPPRQEGRDRDFVGGVEDGGRCVARLRRRARQAQRGEAPVVGRFEVQTADAGQVERLHGLLTAEAGLPDSRAAVAQELLVAELAGSEPLAGLVDDERRRGRVLVLMEDAGGRVYLQVQEDIRALAAQKLDPLGVRWALTGDGFLAAGGVDRLIGDLLSSLALIFGLIGVVFMLLLRDLRLALVALVPNLVPLVFTLATLAVMGADLQTSNIVSFTVAVGLAVDDTIHFVVRYRQERLQGRGTPDALRATFAGAGHAILLTSLLLVIGFSALSTSPLTAMRHFGILSAVTMGAALMADLLLLPALLTLVEGRQRS